MPIISTASATHFIAPGQMVTLEEVTYFSWDFLKRRIEVPRGGNIYFRHNSSAPPFLFENRFGEGSHGISLPGIGWHKIQVRNDSSEIVGITYVVE